MSVSEAYVQTVSALLRNPQGQLLLHLRDERPDLRYPGCWSTLGGRVEPGEQPADAMQRELLEEIELTLPLRFWKRYDYIVHFAGGQIVHVDVHVFIGDIDRDVHKIKLNEGQMLRFFDVEDVDKMPIAFGFEALFKEFFFSGMNSR
jgi:8-oxo-dGTP diphosphatase